MRSIDETFETFGKRVLWLGYAGEEDRSTLIVDLHDILLEFPGATAVLKVRPPDEKAAYPAVTETIDDKLHWSISDSDTAKEGRGELQLSLISPTGSKIKTAVAAMEISRSLPDGGQKPDRIDNWMEKAEVARKKLVVFGDSMAYGHTIPESVWTKLLAEKHGMILTNFAQNGTTITRKTTTMSGATFFRYRQCSCKSNEQS